jgi:all-trans-retinol 13,14-reductase
MSSRGPTHSSKARVRAEPPSSVDVAVIGCGIGGLMAGALMATRGLRVALFDPHYVAGGCATQFARGTGAQRYRFDVGLHYIGDCGHDGVIPRLLSSVGIEQEFVPMDQDGFDTLVFPDLTFRVPADLDLYRERLVDTFGNASKLGIDRYVQLVAEVGQIGDAGMSDAGLAMEYRSATMEEFFDDSSIDDPKLRAVMLGQNGDYALPPSKVSALLHCGLAAHYFPGAYYPKGGGQIISDRLADTIEAHGGTVHLRRAVQSIVVENGVAVGVVTEPRNAQPACTVRARAVLSNADITQTLGELLGREHLSRRWLRRLSRFEMAGAFFMTFLGIKGDMADRGMGRTNYWQFNDYDVEGGYARARDEAEIRPSCVYITSASMKDPTSHTHAPDGVSNVEVMTLVDSDPRKWGVEGDVRKWSYKRNERYLANKQRLEDSMIQRLDDLFPGCAADVVFRESATPLSHTRYTRARGGTGYGLAATPEQFMARRPGVVGPVAGVVVCGASTRAGHGIFGAMLGGDIAARRVLRSLGSRVR